MSKTSEIATKLEQVELVSPQQILTFATQLQSMILENKLYTVIQNRKYVNVEGWQIAGAFTGTFPIVEKVENISTKEKEYKYRAEVSLVDKDGNKVGYGVATCSNSEPGKTRFEEYAVASMAQTRAVGKAFRMKIGWLLKVAGYETTPAEEMDVIREAEVTREAPKKPTQNSINEAISQLERAKTIAELKVLFATLSPSVKNNAEVIAKKDELKQSLPDNDIAGEDE